MKRTFWLASYPKSGNTWFRILVGNLRRDEPADINNLAERNGIASARGRFDTMLLFPSGLLTHEECDRLRPRVHQAFAQDDAAGDPAEEETGVDGSRFVKTHDAWTYTSDHEPLLGGAGAADGAILIVRDPRDVAPSLANHRRMGIDEAITFMADAKAAFCGRRDRQHDQLRQQLPGWSGFQASWLDQPDIAVHPVRYEDLQGDPANTLRGALRFAGIEALSADIERATRFADFSELRRQEQERGFREAPIAKGGATFFRRGVAGGWRDDLTLDQVARIEQDHAAMMERFGYSTTTIEGTTG